MYFSIISFSYQKLSLQEFSNCQISFENLGCINKLGLFAIKCGNTEGIYGILKTNLDKLGIAKVCYEVDGAPMPNYVGASTPSFLQGSFVDRDQSGGAGCYDYYMRIDGTATGVEFMLQRLKPGRHSLVITVTDKSGRSAQSTKLEFCGWDCWTQKLIDHGCGNRISRVW